MDFTVERQPMISGKGDQEDVVSYQMLFGQNGRVWFIAEDVINRAEHIYVSDPSNRSGFGGSVMTFPVRQHGHMTKVKVSGPWHSNSGALLAETGLDVRDTYYTFVVISKGRRYDEKLRTDVMTDVIYKDEKPEMGLFERGEILATQMANELNMKLCLYSESRGGSSCGFIEPGHKIRNR